MNPIRTVQQLTEEQQQKGSAYLEFFRVPSLSTGLYMLPVGGIDGQQPHTEDEVYYVVRGNAHIRIADVDYPVESGSVIYVDAHVPHRFHSITEELAVIVFFAPAEYTHKV